MKTRRARSRGSETRLHALGCRVPIVGDFHYNGHMLLRKYPDCAEALDKYRVNPGNVGFGRKKEAQFATMIEIAIAHDKPVRIGVNWGSLDPALMTGMMDAKCQAARAPGCPGGHARSAHHPRL